MTTAVETNQVRFPCGILVRTLGFLLAALITIPGRALGVSYYVDCSASSNGNGTQNSPWNNLGPVNSHAAFQPGDLILLKRGTSCPGELKPLGSGNGTSVGQYITIDSYGMGARPIISAGKSNNEAIKLNNQQYWHIKNLETRGGRKYGVNINGNLSIKPLHHIYVTGCSFHDSNAANTTTKALLSISQGSESIAIDDVLVDGVTVFNSGHDGVNISASHAIFRNSTVYNTKGSGVILDGATNALADSNVVHNSGASPQGGNGLWEFLCTNCTIQNNEVYNTSDLSGSVDGVTYDIDYDNINNTVQYNYGHDADGYCISVFGAQDGSPEIVTTNSIVRYNICSNNGLGPAHHHGFPQEAEIPLETFWAGGGTGPQGHLNGVQIYNNTIYHNPSRSFAAILEDTSTAYKGNLPNFIKNNIIYSSVPKMVGTLRGSPMTLDYNLYWYTKGTAAQAQFTFQGTRYTGFSNYQGGSGQDAHGIFADPLLSNPTYHNVGRPTNQFTPMMGSPAIDTGTDVCAGITGCSNGGRDFLGTPLPQGSGFDIGAIQQ